MALQAPEIRTNITGFDRLTRVFRRIGFTALGQRINALRGGFDRLRRSAVMTRILGGFRTMGASLAGIGRQVRGLLGPWSALFGVGAAAGLAALTMRFASHGDAIAKTARALGVATDRYQGFLFAAQQSGVETSQFAQSMRGLRQAIRQAIESPDGNVAEVFNRLGVSLHDANGNLRDQFDILQDLMPAFESMRDLGLDTEAGVTADTIFGSRGGQAFINFVSLSQESLQDLIDTAAEVGAIIPEDELTNAERMTDILGELSGASQNVTSAIGSLITAEFGDDLQKFSRWLVDNREQIAEWTRDVVVAVGRVGNQIADFLFGPEQFNIADSPLGRSGGFIEQMMSVLTPIANGIQGIVDLIGGWENALLVIAGLFAGKLLLAVWGVVSGIAQLGVGIGAMVTGAMLGLGRLIARFGALRTAAAGAAAATGAATGAGAGAGAAAGTGLLARLGGLAARVAPPVAAASVFFAQRDTSGQEADYDAFIAEQDRQAAFLNDLRGQGLSEDQIAVALAAQGGFSREQVMTMPAAQDLGAGATISLFDRFGDGAETFEEAAATIREASRADAEASAMFRRAVENPPHGQIDVRVHVDGDGRVRSSVISQGDGVGDVRVNDGVDNPDWALPPAFRNRAF